MFLIKIRERVNHDFMLDVDLELPNEGVTAIYGASGSGKTTLLRCVAGHRRSLSSEISLNGFCWENSAVYVPPHKRRIGMVFQKASLFSHLDVDKNLEFGLKRAVSTPVINKERLVEIFGVEALLDRHCDSLSGGEQQRVAIIRALLSAPQALFFDEALSSLDLPRKLEILTCLQSIQDLAALPMLYVTHSPMEVVRLAKHLLILDKGCVVAEGPPNVVLSDIGLIHHFGDAAGAMLEGVVEERQRQWHLIKVACSGGSFFLKDCGESVGQKVRLHVLAKDVSLSLIEDDQSTLLNRWPVKIETIQESKVDPSMVIVRMIAGRDVLLAKITKKSAATLSLQTGQELIAQVKSLSITR